VNDSKDIIVFIDSTHEPKTGQVNALCDEVLSRAERMPCPIVGVGGGTTLDITKAVSNLLTNEGSAEDYQGWDLVKKPGIFKIGIPTISGTGSESTRTCVMTNPVNGLKLGMNSDYTVFDQIILDPELTATVPRSQYFYTGMDAYIHCLESSCGSYRNAVGDAFGEQTLSLCRQVFLSDDMASDENRARLMVASYLGGCAIATSYVGLVHPFSAGLSVALGVHHCVGNCIVMRAMEEYYPEGFGEFWTMVERQGVEIPKGLCENLTDEQYKKLYHSTIIHEKPLTNALGEGFREVLTFEKVIELFRKM
jgi:3-deoxy-alpha-D-manno-octulosonate 8-oxidase